MHDLLVVLFFAIVFFFGRGINEITVRIKKNQIQIILLEIEHIYIYDRCNPCTSTYKTILFVLIKLRCCLIG